MTIEAHIVAKFCTNHAIVNFDYPQVQTIFIGQFDIVS